MIAVASAQQQEHCGSRGEDRELRLQTSDAARVLSCCKAVEAGWPDAKAIESACRDFVIGYMRRWEKMEEEEEDGAVEPSGARLCFL
jgi:hypothetical protein